MSCIRECFFFQAEDGIRDSSVTGVQTCALPISRVLADMGLLQTPSAKIILSAAVFDDVLGMVLLALVIGVASPQGVNWLSISILAVEAIGFALFMNLVAPQLVRHVLPGFLPLSTRHAP